MLLTMLRNVVGEARCRMFDWRHGVRTCGDAHLNALTISGENVDHGFFYQASHPKFLSEVFESLKIDYSRYLFVDLGSGMGRVMLVASEFPFRRIVGVEFARELHEIACDNIRKYRSASQKCHDVEAVHQDAVTFAFPAIPTVLFMANPFRPAVMVPVLQKLQRSLESDPRDVVLLYTAPLFGDLVERETALRCVERSIYHNTYRLPAAVARGAIPNADQPA